MWKVVNAGYKLFFFHMTGDNGMNDLNKKSTKMLNIDFEWRLIICSFRTNVNSSALTLKLMSLLCNTIIKPKKKKKKELHSIWYDGSNL